MPTKMKLDAVYFDLIKSGKKTFETRVFDPKRQKLKLLEVLEFEHRETKETFQAQIIELAHFKNFREAIVDCGLKKVMPNVASVQKAVTLYETFPHDEGSYLKGAQKYGVLRIKFKLLT